MVQIQGFRGLKVGLALAVSLMAACSRAPQSTAPQNALPPNAIVLLRGNGTEPDSLDPQKARSVEAHNILRDLCEPLTTVAPDAGVAPGAASVTTTVCSSGAATPSVVTGCAPVMIAGAFRMTSTTCAY